jgi:hypothetical protein
VKHRRVKLGDLNNLEGVYDHIFNNLLECSNENKLEQLTNDEPIFFGYNKDGNGSYDNHFSLCMTTKMLMTNIKHIS